MQPRIHIIARPTLDHYQVTSFLEEQTLSWMCSNTATEAEQLIELAGRICYLSFGSRQSPRTNAEYIRNLIISGHESVLEHATWSFLLTNISRAFSHQLVRHRVGIAFSQLSQQYHDETDAEFVEPPVLQLHPEALAIWRGHMNASLTAYKNIQQCLDKGGDLDLSQKEQNRLARSAARSVLPNATETKVAMTANARALRNFLKVRGAIPGDVEMRLVSAELLNILKKEAPAVFFDFHISRMKDGSPIVLFEGHPDPSDERNLPVREKKAV